MYGGCKKKLSLVEQTTNKCKCLQEFCQEHKVHHEMQCSIFQDCVSAVKRQEELKLLEGKTNTVKLQVI
jgi:hypothetical protein